RVERAERAADGLLAGVADAGHPCFGQRRQPQAGRPAVERVGRALDQAGSGELLDQGADRVRSDAELGGGLVNAQAGLAAEQAQELAFGMGYFERFADRTRAVPQSAADAAEDSGQLNSQRRSPR